MGGMGKTVSSRQAGRGSVFDMDRERNFPGRFWNFPQNGTACDGNGCTVCSCQPATWTVSDLVRTYNWDSDRYYVSGQTRNPP